MLKKQFIFGKNSLLEVRVPFFVLFVQWLELVHELHLIQVEGSYFLVILEEDFLLIFVDLIRLNMTLHQIVQRRDILPCERDFEIGLMPFCFLLYFFIESMQVHHFLLCEVIILYTSKELVPLLNVLRIDESIFLQYLLNFWNF